MLRTQLLLAAVLAASAAASAQQPDYTKAAQAFRQAGQPVVAQADGTILAEAEEFRVTRPGWQARPYGTNYYPGTFANSFLSRQAYLGAPEQCGDTTAAITVQVPKAGRYLALVRYEAPYRFEAQFRLRVEQAGRTKLDRLYGARNNPKIWAFGKKLQTELSWSWGAVENMVWEGHDAAVELDAGPATLTLTAGRQPEPAARRNVDLVMLTPDEEQVKMRIEKESYLPLDGMLTQAGDVYLKLRNQPDGTAMKLIVPPGTQHSPYWVHLRTWKPVTVEAKPGESSDWVEVGSLLDSLSDGQWTLEAKGGDRLHYRVEIGVKDAAGAIRSLRTFESTSGKLELAYFGDTRYSHRILAAEEVLYNLLDTLKKQPVRGTAPKRTLIYGYTFDPKPDNPRYNAAIAEFVRLEGITAMVRNLDGDTQDQGPLIRGYIDVRGQSPEKLEQTCQKLKAEGRADRIAVVSLGDEIGLAGPPAGPATDAAFHAWLQGRGLKPSDVAPAAGADWSKLPYNAAADTAGANPGLYYYSKLYANQYGIQQQKALTDVLRRNLPNAGIGANYSPHHAYAYLGLVHQWVSLFREGGMTMPWGEDYVWQIPVASQQVNYLCLDTFRAGIKGHPEEKIHYYVMPHWPGNTPRSWRRQFYGALAHGAKILNLFEFRPRQAAYTENHVNLPEMYQEVRKGFHELGLFEDIIQDGQVRPGLAGLWFSETGDIWDDHHHPFAAAKRMLYLAIRHQQLPLDVVVEQDALAGGLKGYRVLYLADEHVSRAASQAIADWVAAGGRLFATAGAGMFDEFNRPNDVMRKLLGIDPQPIEDPHDESLRWGKQDLPFLKPIDTVTWERPGAPAKMPVLVVRSRFRAAGAEVQGTFADGSPAVATRQVGKGTATYCGFLPGPAYFKPAIPLRPVDRGTTDDSMAHFIPTQFDAGASALIGAPAEGIERPVLCSEPLVDTTIIEAKEGMVIPLTNWSAGPVKGLTVTVSLPVPAGKPELASGAPVKARREGNKSIFAFDLDVADALILRR